jgi:hypothetical protein
MEFNIYDFVIGLFIANSIPHLIFGIMDIRVLSLFGFSALGNRAYSVFCVVFAAGISSWFYGANSLINNSFFLGVLFLYLSFVFTGRFLYLSWKPA